MDLPSWSQMLATDNELGGQGWDKDTVGCAYSLGAGLGSWRASVSHSQGRRR